MEIKSTNWSQSGNGSPVDYWVYRTISGAPKIQLRDVSISGGRQWVSPCAFTFELVSSTGAVYGTASLKKNWGSWTGYVPFANFAPQPKSLRMRVRATVWTWGEFGEFNYEVNTWIADMVW